MPLRLGMLHAAWWRLIEKTQVVANQQLMT
jgi:hypothetical protein